jgi:hypothetical protein
MRKILSLLFIPLFCLSSLSAQTFTGKLNPVPEQITNLKSQAPDTLKLLAVMVQFEADRDASTFGNGKFGSIYTREYGNTILDPLPHDKNYFEAHLEFVKNYFRKVSKGNLIIDYTVLPDTFSVSKVMREYSPPPNSDDFTPMANFASEAWSIARSMYVDFNFS